MQHETQITDNKTIKIHDFLNKILSKRGVSCREFWECQFTFFYCKLYIDLLFFT